MTFDLSEETLAQHDVRLPRYLDDITTEMELLNDAGKMFKESVVETVFDPRLDLPDTLVHPLTCPLEQLDEANDSDSDDGGALDQTDCDEDDNSFKRLVECLTDCFDKFCFVHGTFDSSTFIRLTQTFSKKAATISSL